MKKKEYDFNVLPDFLRGDLIIYFYRWPLFRMRLMCNKANRKAAKLAPFVKERQKVYQVNPVPFNNCPVPHLSLASHKRDIGKQCRRPRSDTAERGVWSESTLFALSTKKSMKHGNNKN